MTFQLARRIRTVMLMVPVCPELGFLRRAARFPGTSRPAAAHQLTELWCWWCSCDLLAFCCDWLASCCDCLHSAVTGLHSPPRDAHLGTYD
jgi:hypothetical protein